ncbi:hypothetical protein AALO_G00219840 [Alosa alosa]|uniref:von Hippel-Lindau disease tumor suppressor n=1 Tax=Alosa alosa TaxID=278164 RepID=A0AAV6G3U1_9TELE|nr:von Hippel-Lindau-like protein [Alosa alosa]KAG5267266.1 hypothetical protein AALO_G00219840 [Alosa alosa]
METRTPLKSLNSDTRTYVIFINKSSRRARAWWLDFKGKPVSYGDISPNGTLRMNTFLTHPWVFRVTENGAKLLANRQEVYYPTLSENKDIITVNITTPVYSLRECCLMVIRRLVKRRDLNRLEIPEMLKHDLVTVPDLSKELEIMNS